MLDLIESIDNYGEDMSKPTKKPTKALVQEKPTSNVDDEQEEDNRPPYPKRKTCKCTRDGGGEPEWEWQGFENVWSCLGCGQTIEVQGKKVNVLF